MSEQIKKWCDAIIFNEDNLELGACKTLKMISDHARTLANQRDTAVKDHIRCCETNNENANKLGFALVKIDALKAALQPFANYACDPPCGCHNCIAKAALEI